MKIMNKEGFIREVAKRAHFTIGDVRIILKTMIEVFEDVMLSGAILNIGSWFRAYPTIVKAYKGWDGFRKKEIDVPESTKIIIKPKRRFWNMMNAKDSNNLEFDEEEIDIDE